MMFCVAQAAVSKMPLSGTGGEDVAKDIV